MFTCNPSIELLKVYHKLEIDADLFLKICTNLCANSLEYPSIDSNHIFEMFEID